MLLEILESLALSFGHWRDKDYLPKVWCTFSKNFLIHFSIYLWIKNEKRINRFRKNVFVENNEIKWHYIENNVISILSVTVFRGYKVRRSYHLVAHSLESIALLSGNGTSEISDVEQIFVGSGGPVGRARKRLHELLEDSFSLFGSREPKPREFQATNTRPSSAVRTTDALTIFTEGRSVIIILFLISMRRFNRTSRIYIFIKRRTTKNNSILQHLLLFSLPRIILLSFLVRRQRRRQEN